MMSLDDGTLPTFMTTQSMEQLHHSWGYKLLQANIFHWTQVVPPNNETFYAYPTGC